MLHIKNMKTNLKTATVRARIEPKVKSQAERVLRTLGISSSEAINVFYRKIVAEQGIPFSLSIPTKETREAIRATRKKDQTEVFTSLTDWKRQIR